MMVNIQDRLIIKSPYYNYLPTVTIRIVRLYALYASKSRANAVVVLKDRHFDTSYL